MKRLICFVLSACVGVSMFISPMTVRAEDVVYAVDDNGTNYMSINDAWNAANNGTKITLQQDWDLESHLVVSSGKEVTVEMNGHTISRTLKSKNENGEVIYVNENAKLNLQGNNAPKTKLAYKNPSGESQSVTSGGLITGGRRDGNGSGIYAKKSEINLENVAIAGNVCNGKSGGGVYLEDDNSVLNMNHAEILDNSAENGGGLYIHGEYTKINMKNESSIHNNAASRGGGIYAYDNFANIQVSGKSSIKDNVAYVAAGAIYICYSFFTIESSDQTGVISGNRSKGHGGAFYVEQKKWGDNSGLVSGFEISGNTAGAFDDSTGGDGGAFYLVQENTTIRNCVIKDNASVTGGAIVIDNDDNTIEDCSITHNFASKAGGVFVGSMYDINLKGKVIIENNRSRNVTITVLEDDLYLETGLFSKSYIKTTPSKDSRIGIRSFLRKFAINQDYYEEGMYFADDWDQAHIEYDSSNKAVNLVSGGIEIPTYTVTVNGAVVGEYNAGDKASIDDAEHKGIFRCWAVESGIELSDLANMYSISTNFTMPANDVVLTTELYEPIKDATLQVEAPVIGKELPTEATLSWTDTSGKEHVATLPDSAITWCTEDGKTASGVAKANKKYILQAAMQKSPKKCIYFEDSADENTVKIKYTNNEDADTTVTYAKLVLSTFRIKGSSVAPIDKTSSVSLNGNVLGNYKEGSTVEVSAKQDNKTFVSWSDVQGITLSDEQKQAETLRFTMPGNDVSLTADYKDYISNVSLSVNQPQPGQDLPTTGILSWDGGSEEVGVTWLKEDQKQTHAEYDSNYTLSCSIAKDDAKGLIFSSKLSKDTVTITMNGLDGNQVASATLDESGTLTLTSNAIYTQLEPVEETDTQSYTITLCAQDEGKTWEEKETMQVKEGEPVKIKAHDLDGKTFVRWENLPEEFSEEDQTITADSISKDLEVTAIYKDEDSSSTGSIFGNANQKVALVIVLVLCGIGFGVYKKKKKE